MKGCKGLVVSCSYPQSDHALDAPENDAQFYEQLLKSFGFTVRVDTLVFARMSAQIEGRTGSDRHSRSTSSILNLLPAHSLAGSVCSKMQRQDSNDGDTTVRMATQRALPAHQAYLQDHLQRMHNEIESTTRKLELEKRRLNKLDEDHELCGDALRMRAECNEKTLKVQKDGQGVPLKKLENRLAKAISQLNLLGHDNAECRNRIDVVRRERLQLIQVFKKLQNDIKDNMSRSEEA
eukprot:s1043_g28.t1